MASGSTWIEANVKETQMEGIAAGQSAEVVFDAYPGQTFAARVEAIGAGTGSEFSLLPAQNAMGNWIKVTQCVPLRLSLLDGEAMQDRLRSGMSATVTIDTGRERKLDYLLSMVGLGSPAAAEVKAP